ncbi:hypothetical protein Kpol_1030p15 [Vanderwaltozyma polyspora DSM 70294]|uniref:Thiaminase-2/PQQC domain-containing protein n=1 Tax=Vanderwaltozyma polyspora (strain ATCC 22028 / DSM 70294 / BCRC 21397 / CBS 2163 / NBRC 10782 / NRRL Y-8283 / UCD 57-17) TaxID=436907 RepID=A7TMT5_VANPO|nr:uncharacterized protein Kpol_1030p15 [Vanderwaltozyma polyspora DSM 70294]EDO16407.1 hypothetical protein Kpol_1030p15 [Vanderwaltozyma polyspora DSM 70294]
MTTTTDLLLKNNQELFKKASQHQLTNEWCLGTLSDRALYIYLAQDLMFFEDSFRLICKTTSLAPDADSMMTLGRKIGFFASDENTYFRDCLKLLAPSVTEEERKKFTKVPLKEVSRYLDSINEKFNDKTSKYTYPALITSLWCAELVYLKWARDSPRAENLHWKYQTWIDLHDGEHFETWCKFLEEEVNKYSIEEVQEAFAKTLQLEYEFFQSCYEA